MYSASHAALNDGYSAAACAPPTVATITPMSRNLSAPSLPRASPLRKPAAMNPVAETISRDRNSMSRSREDGISSMPTKLDRTRK